MGVRFGILSVLNVGIVGGQRARRNMLVVPNVIQSLNDVDVVFCARMKFWECARAKLLQQIYDEYYISLNSEREI